MTNILWLTLVLTFLPLAMTATTLQNLFRNPQFKDSGNQWETLSPTGEFTWGNNAVTLTTPVVPGYVDASTRKLQQVQLLTRGTIYRLYLTLDSSLPQEGYMVVSYRLKHKPENLGVFARLSVRQGIQRLCLEFAPGKEATDSQDPSILSFYLGELKGKVTLRDLQLINATTIRGTCPPFSPQWTVFGCVDPAFPLGDTIPKTIPNPQGSPVSPITVQAKSTAAPVGTALNLRTVAGASRRRFKDTAILYNVFDAPSDGLIPVGASADWWFEARLNGQMVYSTMEKGNSKQAQSPANHVFLLPVKKGRNVFAVKIMAGSQGWSFLWGAAQPPPEPIRFTAKEGYLPIDLSHIVVQHGSALDLSGLLDPPAGKYGRAVITPDGQIAFQRNPRPQRFFGFSADIPENVWKTCSDQDFAHHAAAFAKAMRAQGYNLFRMHGVDAWLMAFSTEDFKPLPTMVDRWDRLIAEMKKQGIYIQLDILAFWLFASEKDWYPVAEARMAHKTMFILGREWERSRFRRGADMLLNHVNPYTGLAWKDDPAILAVEFYNELGLGIPFAHKMEREYPDAYEVLMKTWKTFLQDTVAHLPASQRTGDFTDQALRKPRIPPFWDHSQLRVEYDRMWYENFKKTYDFCLQTVRKIGYPGLTLNCPMPALRETPVSWEKLQVVDAHTYHAHPDNGEQPGSNVDCRSSLKMAASAFRDMYGRRIYGRPFFSNEYNYVFRNPYQYENPIAYAAYASLNRWSSLAIHAGAVALSLGPEDRLSSFRVNNNPVLRAGEFLAAMFFLRRDVAPARHRVAVSLPQNYVFRPGFSGRALAPLQSRLGLLTDVSVSCPDLPIPAGVPAPVKPDLTLMPAGSGDIRWHGWFATAVEGKDTEGLLDANLKELKTKGILAPQNRTDLSRQIYESETGELLLKAREGVMTLHTPRSEAVALTAGKTEALNVLAQATADVNALMGLTSVDGKNLSQAKRMVLVCSTRVANSGMEHEADQRRLRIIGTTPILMQAGTFHITLKHMHNLRCFALRMDGHRTEEIPVKTLPDGTRRMTIRTAALKNGPTPFFELVAENDDRTNR